MKPTVFIGSSTEGLSVLRRVQKLLSPIADVTPWTDDVTFRKPGDYFLDSLLTAASNFDFAVLVFGADDVLRSRKKTQPAPRDNVIFELGLFLSRLGRKRTFVIAPTIWKTRLKVLSDLQGLNLAEYDPPSSERNLIAKLKKPCSDISEQILRDGRRTEPRGPRGVTDVRLPLETLIREASRSGKPVTVRNIALDMETTWPLLREMLLDPKHIVGVTWQSLMVDSSSDKIREAASETVSLVMAQEREKNILSFFEKHGKSLEKRHIRFECRAYGDVPVLHGFLCNSDTAFLSLCRIEEGKLVGAPNPYIRLDRPKDQESDVAAEHFLSAFEDWFALAWARARRVYPSS